MPTLIVKSMSIRIAIIDNDRFALNALRHNIESMSPDFHVIWTEQEGSIGIVKAMTRQTKPQVLILDISLNDMSGIQVCRAIRQRSKTIGIITITSYQQNRFRQEAVTAGAQALLSKESPNLTLERCIRTVAEGKPFPSDSTFNNASDAFETLRNAHNGAAPTLSQREAQVLLCYKDGLRSPDIANRLGITKSSVDQLAKRAATKLGTTGIVQTVATAVERQLI